MEYKIELVKKYFALAESFCTESAEYDGILHPEMTATEFPSLNVKETRTRNRREMLAGMEAARKTLDSHRFDIHTIYETPEVLVIEAGWSGRMAADSGNFKKGQELKAHCCFIFEFKDGKIYRQRNYDCYEP